MPESADGNTFFSRRRVSYWGMDDVLPQIAYLRYIRSETIFRWSRWPISLVPEMFTLLIPPEWVFISFPHAAPTPNTKLTAKIITMVGGGDITRTPAKNWHYRTVVDKQNESVEVIGIQSEKPRSLS